MYRKIGLLFVFLLLLACKVERVLYVNSLESSERTECNLTQETEATILDKEISLDLQSSEERPKIRDKVNISLEGSQKGPYSWTIVQNNQALCLTSSQSKEKAKVLSRGLSSGQLYLADPYRFATKKPKIDLYFQEPGQYSIILETGEALGITSLTVGKADDLEIVGIEIIDQQTSQEVDEMDKLISGNVYSFVAIFEGDDGGQEPEIRWYSVEKGSKTLQKGKSNNAVFTIPKENSLKMEACLVDNSSCKQITKSIIQ